MKIKNQKLKIKNSAGFTLVELLASVIVLIAVGSIIAGLVASSLRGTNKTNTIENIRQNGNYALNQMSKDIKFALPFDGVNTGLGNLNSDGEIVYVASCPYSLDSPPVPVETPYEFITVQSADNITTKYACSASELSANEVSLIDADTNSLESCSLSCIQTKATDTPIIKIKFVLNSKASGGLAENIGSVIFETSVTMKNYRK